MGILRYLKRFDKDLIKSLVELWGPPGSGKSLLGSQIAFAKERANRIELENKILAIESEHFNYDFYKLRIEITAYFVDYYKKLISSWTTRRKNFKTSKIEQWAKSIEITLKNNLTMGIVSKSDNVEISKNSKEKIEIEFKKALVSFNSPHDKEKEFWKAVEIEMDDASFEEELTAFDESYYNDEAVKKAKERYEIALQKHEGVDAKNKYLTAVKEASKRATQEAIELFIKNKIEPLINEMKNKIELYFEKEYNSKIEEKSKYLKHSIEMDFEDKRIVNAINTEKTLDFYILNRDKWNECDFQNGIYEEQWLIDYSYYFYILNLRGSMLVSNVPLFSKVTQTYSTIVNLNWFRYQLEDQNESETLELENKNYECLWEPYIIVVLDEIDKDFQSYLGGTQLVEDGTIASIQMSRHMACNKGLWIWIHQIVTGLQKQVRGNMEAYISMQVEFKLKQPTLIRTIAWLFIKFFLDITKYIFFNYKYRRKRIKNTINSYVWILKKNNVSTFELFLKRIYNLLYRRYCVLRRKSYFQIGTKISDNEEMKKAKKHNFKINYLDVQGTYANTFYSLEYNNNLINNHEKLLNRQVFKNKYPSKKEIALINSKHMNNFFKIK